MGYTVTQQMLTLSYIAYCGYALTGSDKKNAQSISTRVSESLALEPPTADDWKLVWGPAVNELWLSLFDDNMAYIAQHRKHSHKFAVVFRGTNPVSLSNWIVEDFFVFRKKPWKNGRNSVQVFGNRPAKISLGTHTAMERVRALNAPVGVPGAGTTMLQFLRIQAETQNKPLELYVTGHSLGATLATTYALFLKQASGQVDIPVKDQWDPEGKACIRAYAFAGATAGNKAFADYSDSQLDEKHLHRFSNSLDIVPHAWNKDTVSKIKHLYLPTAKPNLLVDVIVAQASLASFLCDYTQPQAQQPFLKGELVPNCKEYFQQAIYQHVVAYPNLLGLGGILDAEKYFPILKDVLPSYSEITPVS